MKKLSFLLTCALTASFFFAQAQFKPVSSSEILTSTNDYSAKASINKAVMASFHALYPNASDDAWTRTAQGYLVSFNTNDIANHVFLNKKGKMTSQIRYYTEKDLPADVRDLVNTLGGNYTIGLIREVTTERGTAHLVTIDYGTSWQVVRVAGSEMDVYEAHKKG